VLLSELHSLTSAQASFCLYRRSIDYLFAITIKTRHCNVFFSVHFASLNPISSMLYRLLKSRRNFLSNASGFLKEHFLFVC
jgi:hypothetical protein